MGIVKLPSGKTVRTPDGMTKEENIEFLFKNLEGREGFEEDREKLGRQLDTSGWGATIGGITGGITGAVAGIFTSPSLVVNPVTLGSGLSAGGAGTGEKIEQWWTGRGDWDDVKDVTKEAALWGLVPGGAGAATKGAIKLGAQGLKKTAAGVAGGGASGATVAKVLDEDPLIGAGIGAVGGGVGINTPVGKKLLKGAGETASEAVAKKGGPKGVISTVKNAVKDNSVVKGALRHTGIDREINSVAEAVKKPAEDYVSGMFKMATGRSAAGGLQTAGAIWDIKRNVAGYIFTQLKKKIKVGGKVVDDSKLRLKAEEMASELVEDNAQYAKFAGKFDDSLEGVVGTAKPKGKPVEVYGTKYIYDDATGALYDYSGNFKGTHPGFKDGGQIEDKRKNKLRLLHSEGYDPKQAYAIMKSYEERGKLNMGGEALPRYEGGGLVNQDVVEGAHIPDTMVSSIPVGSYIVNAAAANHPQFKRELLEMGGKVIEDDFNPKFGKDYVEAMVGKEEIYLNPHITKKHGKYIEQVNDWGRDVKQRLGT